MSFLAKIGISVALFFTSIGNSLGFVHPSQNISPTVPQAPVVTSRMHVAHAIDTKVASSSSFSNANKIVRTDSSYRVNDTGQRFSVAMQALGCTDEYSCKNLCSKLGNSEKCRLLFGGYGNGDQKNSQVTNSNLAYEYAPNDCKKDPAPIFSHDITDVSKISSIFPPAHVIGGELKTRAYIHVTDKVPLYAPVDAVLVEGSYHLTVDGLAQYSLYFQVSCEVRFLFDHVSGPIEAIKSEFPATPAHDSRTMGLSHTITFKAGDLIGYTAGTLVGKTFDFAVFNNTLPNYFSTQPNYNNNWVYDYAVCPFNYFGQDKKSIYFSLFANDSGSESTPVELCK